MKNTNTFYSSPLLMVLCSLLFSMGSTSSLAQTFSMDSSFGTHGRKELRQATGNSGFYDVQRQSDGKIVSAGYINNYTQDAFLTRRNTDGSPDNSFGNSGNAALNLGADEYISSIAIQSDGKIVACGVKTTNTGRFMLLRTDPAGNIDLSFGNQGIVDFVNINGTNTINASFRNLKIQNDGMIVACGYAWFSNEYRGVVQRYKTNGTLDSTFGTNGTVIVKYVNGSHNYAEDIHIQIDGKILVLGSSYLSTDKMHIMRLNTGGSIDNSFGTSGTATPAFTGFTGNYPTWIGTLPDDRIIIVGNAYTASQQKVVATRLNTTGQVESTYGTNGFAQYQGSSGNNYGYDGHIDVGNGLTIALEYYTSGTGNAAIIRTDSNGSLVNSYGSSGIATFTTLDDGWASSLVSDGDSIYLAGAMKSNSENAFKGYMLKATEVGSLATSFGLLAFPMGIAVSEVARMYSLSNGDLLATGTNSNMNNDQFVIKLSPNGSPVTTFGANGLSTFNGFGYELVKDAIVLPNQYVVMLSETGRRSLTFSSLGTFTGNDKYTISVIGANGQPVGTIHSFSIDANKFPYGTKILPDNNGNYIVLGHSSEPVEFDRYLTRHNAGFGVDASYGTNGRIHVGGSTTSVAGNYGDIVIAPDNDVILCHAQTVFTLGNPFARVLVDKYKDNGTKDQTFGSFGQYELDDTVGGGLKASGEIFKGKEGYYLSYIKNNDLKIRALTFSGAVGSFGTVNLGPYRLAGFHQLPDSSLLIACQKDSLCRVVHVLSNGTIDAGFNQTGAIEVVPFEGDNNILDWQVLPDTGMVLYHQFRENNKPTFIGLSKISHKNNIVTNISVLTTDQVQHSIFPNPVVDGFYVQTNDANLNASAFNYRLFDQAGRNYPIIVTAIAPGRVYIDSRISMPPGNYILLATGSDGKRFSSKILKK